MAPTESGASSSPSTYQKFITSSSQTHYLSPDPASKTKQGATQEAIEAQIQNTSRHRTFSIQTNDLLIDPNPSVYSLNQQPEPSRSSSSKSTPSSPNETQSGQFLHQHFESV
ncbi:hypothetical protein Droror1_Dr00017435 [Drosera rotundifolia]